MTLALTALLEKASPRPWGVEDWLHDLTHGHLREADVPYSTLAVNHFEPLLDQVTRCIDDYRVLLEWVEGFESVPLWGPRINAFRGRLQRLEKVRDQIETAAEQALAGRKGE